MKKIHTKKQANEKPAETIMLYVYRGQDGAFTLYEDEGTNYNYEKGAYSNIPFTYNEAEETLTIGQREGKFGGMLKERIFVIVAVSKDKPKALDLDSNGLQVYYDGQKQDIKL